MLVEVSVGFNDLVQVVREMNGMPVVVKCALLLRDKNTIAAIPMWISDWERSQILDGLDPENAPAMPQPHDLCVDISVSLGGRAEKAEISHIEGDKYCAFIHMRDKEGNFLKIKANAPDAVAVAARLKIPIFVEEGLFIKALESEEAQELIERVYSRLKQAENRQS